MILNKIKVWSLTCREKFQNPPVFCQPACLPAVRPTSGRRIGQIFSYNTEYRLVNTDLLFQLRFIHCAMLSPFILHCFPFSLTGDQKGEKKFWTGANEFYGLYLLRHANGQIHVCLIASSLKIINKRVAAVYQFKLARNVFMLSLICMFLGCDLPIQLLL